MERVEQRQVGSINEPWLFFEPLRYQVAYLTLILVSSLDILMTWYILDLGGSELNPLADVVLRDHGWWGIIIYKFALMVFFIVICEEIGRKRPLLGWRMSGLAVAISSIPIVWAIALLSNMFRYLM